MWTFLKTAGRAATLAILGTTVAMAQATAPAEAIDGRWDAYLTSQGTVISFRLDISGSGATLKGTLYNGFRPYDGTTSATFDDNKLVLRLDHYLTTITATLKDGKLTGNIASSRVRTAGATAPKAADTGASEPDVERLTKIESGENPSTSALFQAVRHEETDVAAPADVPQIGGSWIIPLDSPTAKGESAFRFYVEQRGADVEATILRIDGDSGTYSGTYKDGRWALSHFDGGRPGVIEVALKKDGSIEILQKGGLARNAATQDRSNHSGFGVPGELRDERLAANAGPNDLAVAPLSGRFAPKLIAYRPEVAKAKGLPEPDSYQTHTGIRDPNEVFKFKFPDDRGNIVSNEDPRFNGKVVLAVVSGTWCPPCHDEIQYLVQLDKKYRDRGLAIVAFDFEEPEQQKSLTREQALVKHYGVKYTYLIAGDKAEVWEKIPQFINLNSWPTTIFIGRDGKVKATHTGFASPAAGDFHRQLREEFESKIEKLLSEKAPQSVADAGNSPVKGGQ
jgi:thiol-disulfide isomerase/thioredoxin